MKAILQTLRSRAVFALVTAGVVLTTSTAVEAAAFNEYRPAPQYDEVDTTSLYLPMRDGVRIALQIMRPAKNGKPVDGKFPVVWQGTLALPGPPRPADPNADRIRADWSRLVNHGYVVVDVARRAHGPSFGTRRSYHDREEAYDAYEITEWLASQPWSNGNVGMHGCSNTGEAVMHAITVAPPHLKAAWAGCFSWTKYDAVLRGSGIIANWGSGPTRSYEEDMQTRPVDGDESKTLLAQAVKEHAESVDLYALMQTIPYRDSWSPLTRSRFAVEGSAGTYADQLKRANVALYIQGGWYDDFRKDGFIALANMPDTRLVIGPWTHCANDNFDLISESLRFYDHYLKGMTTGIEADDPIHYYVVGAPEGQQWQAAKQWPSVKDNGLNFYLGKGKLQPKAPRAGKQTFVADYDVTCGAEDGKNAVLRQPCHPTRGAATFTGPILKQATEITGHPVVKLWVSSANTRDARVFVYLEDVAPDGTITALTDGRQLLSLRKLSTPPWAYYDLPWKRSYREDSQPLIANEPVEVAIDMLPISYVFQAGHRMQVTVSGSDPRERLRTEADAPELTVHYGKGMVSEVNLPVR
ncbi:MAG: CocE/NonD family hydrolase [Gammaproteobacteria bacterium]|nr:CocE/NonD family hydrolase [Gammaproteobacteria bacterium]